MSRLLSYRCRYLACTSLAAITVLATPAYAQEEPSDGFSGLGEIIVTAQKREQSLQDVPIAVTAVTQDALQVNRVANVMDLSSLAPGFTVRQSIGGSAIPFFAMRGALISAVVPGVDKQLSLNIDGVYVQGMRGAIFELPDVERIEVLRGPQGTLFGRNSTAGAISISTRDPSGKAGVKAGGTFGNRDRYRFRLTADTPQIGPFSAYASFMHEEYRGATRNVLAGQTWDYTRSFTDSANRIVRSPKWLGGQKADNYFVALKFEPSTSFKATYKFDHGDNAVVNDAIGVLGIDDTAFYGPLWRLLLEGGSSEPYLFDNANPQTTRPDKVYNGGNTATEQKQTGHNLTATFEVNDQISIKNILAHRKASILSVGNTDAVTGLKITQAIVDRYPAATFGASGFTVAQIGQPFVAVLHQPEFKTKQWSNELQVNFASDFVTMTVGGIYYDAEDQSNPHGYANSQTFRVVPNGVLPIAPGISINTSKSLAGFAQGEFHLTPQLDVVLGGRITKDKKGSRFSYIPAGQTDFTVFDFDYKDTQFSYLVGANYRLNPDAMVYAKYSTGYVSGGTVGPLPYEPEKAKSAELGFKGDFLNRRLRTNVALWWAKYSNNQGTGSASALGQILVDYFVREGIDPSLAGVFGTFVVDRGTIEAKGIELEVTAAPTQGLTFGGNLSYTDAKPKNVPQFAKLSVSLPANAPDSDYKLVFLPEWTASVFAQYDTPTLFGDAYATFRVDANYQSESYSFGSGDKHPVAVFRPYTTIPDYWLLNGRAALRDVEIGGVTGEVALWGKNILNKSVIQYPLLLQGLVSTTYNAPRSYGVDFTVQF